jgi:hypothetical protein
MTTGCTRSMNHRVLTRLGVATVVMVGLMGSLAAAGPTARAGYLNDDKFLEALRSQGINYRSEAAAISAGHLVCTDLDDGEVPSQVAHDLMNSSDLDAFHAGYFVGASIGAYCPKYASAS